MADDRPGDGGDPKATSDRARLYALIGTGIVALVVGFIAALAIFRKGESGGSLLVNVRDGTVEWERFAEQDVFTLLNSAYEGRPDAANAWLLQRGFVSIEDEDRLRQHEYYRFDDPELAEKLSSYLPQIPTDVGTDQIFSAIEHRRQLVSDNAALSRLRALSSDSAPPFQFLGRSDYVAASPNGATYQPHRGEVRVAIGSDLARRFQGQIVRIRNPRSGRVIDLRVVPYSFSEADLWFNRAQYCRLGLTARTETVEVGPSPISASQYDPQVADPVRLISITPNQCAELLARG